MANLLTGLGVDEIFSRTDANGNGAFLSDALGSTVALTDAAGALQTQYTYEPFGGTSVIGTLSSNSVQYTGRENDGLGVYYYRARYYSSNLQRFMSEDPMGFAGGSNLYEYVENDPLAFVDPFGLKRKGPRPPSPPKPPLPPEPPEPPLLAPPPITPVVQRDNGKSIPNVPPDRGFCSTYRDGTGAGDILYGLCMGSTNSPWSNCVRGKLLNQYVPNGNPLDLSIYLFWDHPRDFATCAIQ